MFNNYFDTKLYATRFIAPSLWFHDIYQPDGQPYDKKEVAYLIKFNKKKAG